MRLLTLSAIGLMATALAACSGEKPAAPVAAAGPTTADITAADLAYRVKELADDKYEGRGPGTPAGEAAADWIAAEMKRAGLEPGNPDGTYFQVVKMVAQTVDPTKSSLSISGPGGKTFDLKYGPETVYATKDQKNTTVSFDNSDLVFVGYGVVAPEAKWNDYAGVDVKGKTVVMFVNDPGFITNDDTLFNATLIAEGPRCGLRWCLFLGAGAVVMEALYCACAFAGFAGFFESRWVHATIELVSFLLMLWLGVKYLRGGPLPGEQRMENFVEVTFHPHTAFWTGFFRVLGNPGVLLLWITVAATLLSREWIENRWSSKWPFIAGVAAGGFGWFAVVGWGVTRGHGKFSNATLRRFSQASGVLLLVVAAVVGSRLVHLLASGHAVKQ